MNTLSVVGVSVLIGGGILSVFALVGWLKLADRATPFSILVVTLIAGANLLLGGILLFVGTEKRGLKGIVRSSSSSLKKG